MVVHAINPVFLPLPFDSGPYKKGSLRHARTCARSEPQVGSRAGPPGASAAPHISGSPFCTCPESNGMVINTGFIAFAMILLVFSY